MAQFSYDVVPHKGGWAIQITPMPSGSFATQQAAFDVSADFARKLRFVGFSMNVRTRDDAEHAPPGRNRRAG